MLMQLQVLQGYHGGVCRATSSSTARGSGTHYSGPAGPQKLREVSDVVQRIDPRASGRGPRSPAAGCSVEWHARKPGSSTAGSTSSAGSGCFSASAAASNPGTVSPL
jgi:hypothetical protein